MSQEGGVVGEMQTITGIYKKNPRIGLIIQRRLNKNLVVYEIKLGKNDGNPNIDSYWLDLDPAYQHRKRLKGISSDRDDFSKMDKYAYGLNTKLQKPGTVEFTFKRFPSQTFEFVYSESSSSCFMQKGNRRYKIHNLYIHDVPALGFLWPSVDYVQICCFDVETGKRHFFRIDT